MSIRKYLVSYSALFIGLFQIQIPASGFEIDNVKLINQIDISKYPVGARLEVVPGELDSRLTNGSCASPQLSFTKGSKPWGRSLIQVQCAGSNTSFYQTVDVKVWGMATVAQGQINFQETIQPEHLKQVEMDLSRLPPMGWSGNPQDIFGKQSTRVITSGTVIRADMFKAKAAIQSGDTVKISMKGVGFKVSSDGVALSSANLGQTIRVRTPQGKVLTGEAKGDLIVEVAL